MKRILFVLSFIACHLSLSSVTAQNADFQKVAARYKNVKAVTAQVVKTTHKDAVAKDVVTRGALSMKSPSEVSITMEGGKDMLLMRGSAFTMVVKGSKHTTDSRTNPQFASFQTVFESLLAGGTKDITQLKDLTVTHKGGQLVLTITPQPADKKAARRMLFSSFVLTIDAKTSELRTLRMNEKAGYTEYAFSNFQFK